MSLIVILFPNVSKVMEWIFCWFSFIDLQKAYFLPHHDKGRFMLTWLNACELFKKKIAS